MVQRITKMAAKKRPLIHRFRFQNCKAHQSPQLSIRLSLDGESFLFEEFILIWSYNARFEILRCATNSNTSVPFVLKSQHYIFNSKNCTKSPHNILREEREIIWKTTKKVLLVTFGLQETLTHSYFETWNVSDFYFGK